MRRSDDGAARRAPVSFGNVSGDGVVDFADFSAVLSNYGAACR